MVFGVNAEYEFVFLTKWFFFLQPGMSSSPAAPGGPRGNMALSPMSSANTPQMQADQQPGSQEDRQYLDKIRQLSVYIEPLREMIASIGDADQNKLDKMKKLMDILSNPSKRMPMDTLLKCEKVLEKMTFNMDPKGRGDSGPAPSPSSSINPLLESIIKLLNAQTHSTELNHALQKSFGAPLEAIYGSDITLSPLPADRKRRRRRGRLSDEDDSGDDVEDDEDDDEDEDGTGLPLVVRREISMLEGQYQVSVGESADDDDGKGKKARRRRSSRRRRRRRPRNSAVTLTCRLRDSNLPSVPPITVSVPPGYPDRQPSLCDASEEYRATPFLRKVEEALAARMKRMPETFTLTQMMVAWEMSVRSACSPKRQVQVTAQTVLMGL